MEISEICHRHRKTFLIGGGQCIMGNGAQKLYIDLLLLVHFVKMWLGYNIVVCTLVSNP